MKFGRVYSIMSIRNKYEEELKRVFGKLVAMCRATEQAIDRSVTALRDRNAALSREVMEETGTSTTWSAT